MAVFGYGRVSNKEQQSENQRLELERAGYDVSYWFADESVSGQVPALERAQFRILLDKICNGETLVVSSSTASAATPKTSTPRSRCWPRAASRSSSCSSGSWT